MTFSTVSFQHAKLPTRRTHTICNRWHSALKVYLLNISLNCSTSITYLPPFLVLPCLALVELHPEEYYSQSREGHVIVCHKFAVVYSHLTPRSSAHCRKGVKIQSIEAVQIIIYFLGVKQAFRYLPSLSVGWCWLLTVKPHHLSEELPWEKGKTRQMITFYPFSWNFPFTIDS